MGILCCSLDFPFAFGLHFSCVYMYIGGPNVLASDDFGMNANVIVIFLFVLCATVLGLPATDNLNNDGPYIRLRGHAEESEVLLKEKVGVRFRRVTCDLLSFSTKLGSLNHSACAANCLAKRKGFKGGRCINGVCHCRR